MSLNSFFAKHPVFTTDEVAGYLNRDGTRSHWTRKALLAHHVRQGNILRVRRGLYAVIPPTGDPDTSQIDPFLLAGKMTDDAVLGYHTALEFHGKSYTLCQELRYLTDRHLRPVCFRAYRFRPVLFPKALRRKQKVHFAVNIADRLGLEIRITSLERTLVDVLDRPEISGEYEEIWRSLESIEFFDLDSVIEYALLLDNATTAAKVGFFLEQHREELMVEENHLSTLRKHRPKQPHYFNRDRKKPARFAADWNLIIPMNIFERSWQEIG